MRVLGSTMLSLQAIVLLLALPVAITVNGADPALATWLFVSTAIACFIAVGVVTKPAGQWLGWIVQAATIGLGFLVPWLFALAAIFVALWWASVHFAAKIEQLNVARGVNSDPE